jgi:cell division protein FtsI/penicillin-binding protein 2
MSQPTQYRRILFLAVMLVIGFGLLGYRLFDVQIVRHEELADLARNNTQRTIVREPRRGDIRDVRGNLLATSKAVKTICADPSLLISNEVLVARTIAPILGMDAGLLAEKLRGRPALEGTNGIRKSQRVVLKKKVEEEEWRAVRAALTNLSFAIDERKLSKSQKTFYSRLRYKSLFTEPEETRVYPNGPLAAHVLGYVGLENDAKIGRGEEAVGKDGVERTMNSVLSGVAGWRQTETDSGRSEMVALREQDVAPKDGLNVVLTLDAGIQHIVETELADAMQKHSPISVSAVVLRPRTGEILAMATLPTYDPNKVGDAAEGDRRNRIITDLAEPGSTFKIVVVSGALNENLLSLDDSVDCEHGHFYFMGKPLHDEHPFGILTVENIIGKSSNIGAAKVGIKMGEQLLNKYVQEFGFGRRTGIPLPGEVSGIVHAPAKWSKLSISRIPMGHEVAVTPLQMVMAMSAIANGGVLMRPMLVDRLEDAQGRVAVKYQPAPGRRVIREATAREMVRALKTVVSTNGTAIEAKLNNYTVAGKTGTAQKISGGGYSHSKYFSSFIGFFPADRPELCISVVFDEPKQGHFGGKTAGPVFQRIAERAANYLAIPPELGSGDVLAGVARPILTSSFHAP